jgi:hypothetical protein
MHGYSKEQPWGMAFKTLKSSISMLEIKMGPMEYKIRMISSCIWLKLGAL